MGWLTGVGTGVRVHRGVSGSAASRREGPQPGQPRYGADPPVTPGPLHRGPSRRPPRHAAPRRAGAGPCRCAPPTTGEGRAAPEHWISGTHRDSPEPTGSTGPRRAGPSPPAGPRVSSAGAWREGPSEAAGPGWPRPPPGGAAAGATWRGAVGPRGRGGQRAVGQGHAWGCVCPQLVPLPRGALPPPEPPQAWRGAPVPPIPPAVWGRLWALARLCPTAAHPRGQRCPPRHTRADKAPTAGPVPAATGATPPAGASPAAASGGATRWPLTWQAPRERTDLVPLIINY